MGVSDRILFGGNDADERQRATLRRAGSVGFTVVTLVAIAGLLAAMVLDEPEIGMGILLVLLPGIIAFVVVMARADMLRERDEATRSNRKMILWNVVGVVVVVPALIYALVARGMPIADALFAIVPIAVIIVVGWGIRVWRSQ